VPGIEPGHAHRAIGLERGKQFRTGIKVWKSAIIQNVEGKAKMALSK
jgi:hypothetical protein